MSTRTAVPAGPFRRAIAAFGSLVLLGGLIGGLPVALALLAGNPLPSDSPTVDGIWSALTSRDDGGLFLTVLTVVGWLAWASFTGSVMLEVSARLFRRRAPSIPGLRGQQRFAAVLVAAVAALAATPSFTSASAALVDSPPPAAAPATPVEQPAVRGLGPAGPAEQQAVRGLGAADSVLHLVERGEGILDLEDRYGVPWQRIAETNYGAEQPDGRTLERGQTRIYPGWQLRIPTGPATAATTPAAPPVQAGLGEAGEPGRHLVDTRGDSTDLTSPVAAAEQAAPEYEIAKGDWMWHVADRYLGDPERYRDIAELNPQYADQHGDFPDHIEPGWTLQLPEDAVDSGPGRHATGTATSAAPEYEPEPPSAPVPTPAPAAPAPAPAAPERAAPEPAAPERAAPAPATRGPDRPEPAVSVGFGAAPAEAAGAERAGDGFTALGEQNLERLAPAALAGAGLLTALVLASAAYHRYRRHQHHRPGLRFASVPAQRLERTLRAAQQPLDAARLDAALRALAAGLAHRGAALPDAVLPDIAGAMVDAGMVHLLLAEPCPDPPAPWRDNGDRWSLPAEASLPPAERSAPLAPLPTLAAVGSQAGIHLLLDLERLGFLAIHGDPGRAMDLLRYLAAELACNTWSDATEVLVTGFDPRETELLVAVNADRIRAVPSIADAVTLLRQRVASARATLGHAGAADAFAGRVRGVAADAWMPQVLIAAAPTPPDMTALSELEHELEGARCAVAVATTDRNPPKHGAWRVTVTPDGVVHVRLPFLRASLSAAALSMEELVPLADTMRAARGAPQVPVPPAAETEAWAAGTDSAGVPRMPDPLGAEPATVPPPPHGEADPDLDEDLRAWHAGGAGRPRIGILGPVVVDAPGPPPESRRRLHAELVVFLAQRGARGADAKLLDATLWPDVTVTEPTRQLAITRIRRWLGTDRGGAPWLPDVDADLTYRLAEGCLFDWHLFRRLRTRGETRGPDGADDLRAALRLVRGVPLDGGDRPRAPGTRNPFPWLAESDMHPDHVVATIVDTAHHLAELCLAGGDPAGARWAAHQAWLADTNRGYDDPWRDLLRAEHADGQTGRLRSVLAELMAVRDAEAAEDLAPETYQLISAWPPNVLIPSG